MGQCHYCARTKELDPCPTRRSSDPRDSSHSNGDEVFVDAGKTHSPGVVVEVEDEGLPRGSNSSDSSGKYSLRGCECALGEERHPLHLRTEDCCLADTPVFEDEEEDEGGGSRDGATTGASLQPPHGAASGRKVSHGSVSSERSSFSSVTSMNIMKARLGRSSSLTVPTLPQDPSNACQCPTPCATRTPRTVSLRLSRSHHDPHDHTNLPTIYVDDSPRPQCRGRRSSLRRALSLLSLDSLLHSEATTKRVTTTSQPRQQKPVQKILRQPRRRHNTVRGMSGLAIDGANQRVAASGTAGGGGGGGCGALQRAHTLYYPTATTMRHASTRRARSVAT